MDQRTTWLFLFLTPIWLMFHPAGGETHSLTYIYTAFSKPVHLPGIHEFTAMGLLDGRMIDYYDSVKQKKVPKQSWMGERLDADYWEKGTRSRQSKEQWFKVNIEILMKRMRQNNTDPHILQWRHGCEIDKQVGGASTFKRGMDMYSYDGNDFLSFNDADSNWIAPVDAALPTKRKWDEVTVLKDYTKGYLEKECVEWLEKFLVYGERALQMAIPPEVFVFARTSKSNSKNTVLTCMATGFLPKDIIINIKRNGRVVDEMDGLKSTKVRPNEDDTHQIRLSVEILQTDSAEYVCEVYHPATNVHIVEKWDHQVDCISCAGGIAGGVVGGLLVGVLIGGVVAFMYFKKRGPFAKKGNDTPPVSSVSSSLATTNGNGDVGIYMNTEEVPLAAENKPMKEGEAAALMGQTNGDSDSGRGGSPDGSHDNV